MRTIDDAPCTPHLEHRSARIGHWLGQRAEAVAMALEPVDAWLSTRRYLFTWGIRQGWRSARWERHGRPRGLHPVDDRAA